MKEFNCLCDDCRDGCLRRPGWFKRDQIPSLLKHFEVKDLGGLLKKGLALDYWAGANEFYILAPALCGMHGRAMYPFWPRGRCVFLNDKGRCDIYPVRPYECAVCSHVYEASKQAHYDAAETWKDEEIQILLSKAYRGLK